MVGDIIQIREEYYRTSEAILRLMNIHQGSKVAQMVIGIAGESGSGKSVTAVCLQQKLNELGFKSLILHQDDYFLLPPGTNHDARKQDITQVGTNEVHLRLLQEHIDAFKAGQVEITKPVVYYKQNQILAETIALSPYQFLIVEGTYTFFLENLDGRIFMDRTYRETIDQRKSRGREAMDPFVEEVLAIEHHLIRPTRTSADLIVNRDYSVIQNTL